MQEIIMKEKKDKKGKLIGHYPSITYCNNEGICNLGYACDACPYNNQKEIIKKEGKKK